MMLYLAFLYSRSRSLSSFISKSAQPVRTLFSAWRGDELGTPIAAKSERPVQIVPMS